jgi:AGCS family alanine or glycine:cation symporter
MSGIREFSEVFVNFVWGDAIGFPLLVCLLFGSGAFFSIYYGFPQLRLFKHALDVVRGKYDKPGDSGEISHFQALCAALSGTIGLGNIAGVAVAIAAGGPGAVFWMWISGLLGMTTKFTSISLSLIHREVNEDGSVNGGPMYTIKHGLGKNFMWLAVLFSFFAIASSFGAGNMFQANQATSILNEAFGIPTYLSGTVLLICAGLVLIGGIKRIGGVAGRLVPIMVSLYFIAAIGILLVHIGDVPAMLAQIVTDAFTGTAAAGGFQGVIVKEVVLQGVRRGTFSNEAGMGSAAIAHSAARSTPIQEGVVGLLEPFIDTVVVCTITALVILITGAWTEAPMDIAGVNLTSYAFASVYGKAGEILVLMTVVLFAFSTIISWSYYGEKGVTFLFGKKGVMPYRVIFTVFILIGALLKLDPVINISDALFGLMAFPNLLANLLLAGTLKKELKKYTADLKAGKFEVTK